MVLTDLSLYMYFFFYLFYDFFIYLHVETCVYVIVCCNCLSICVLPIQDFQISFFCLNHPDAK